MKSYVIADGASIIALTNKRARAVRLVKDLEQEDKYLGLYSPKRYAIYASDDGREIVRRP